MKRHGTRSERERKSIEKKRFLQDGTLVQGGQQRVGKHIQHTGTHITVPFVGGLQGERGRGGHFREVETYDAFAAFPKYG